MPAMTRKTAFEEAVRSISLLDLETFRLALAAAQPLEKDGSVRLWSELGVAVAGNPFKQDVPVEAWLAALPQDIEMQKACEALHRAGMLDRLVGFFGQHEGGRRGFEAAGAALSTVGELCVDSAVRGPVEIPWSAVSGWIDAAIRAPVDMPWESLLALVRAARGEAVSPNGDNHRPAAPAALRDKIEQLVGLNRRSLGANGDADLTRRGRSQRDLDTRADGGGLGRQLAWLCEEMARGLVPGDQTPALPDGVRALVAAGAGLWRYAEAWRGTGGPALMTRLASGVAAGPQAGTAPLDEMTRAILVYDLRGLAQNKEVRDLPAAKTFLAAAGDIVAREIESKRWTPTRRDLRVFKTLGLTVPGAGAALPAKRVVANRQTADDVAQAAGGVETDALMQRQQARQALASAWNEACEGSDAARVAEVAAQAASAWDPARLAAILGWGGLAAPSGAMLKAMQALNPGYLDAWERARSLDGAALAALFSCQSSEQRSRKRWMGAGNGATLRSYAPLARAVLDDGHCLPSDVMEALILLEYAKADDKHSPETQARVGEAQMHGWAALAQRITEQAPDSREAFRMLDCIRGGRLLRKPECSEALLAGTSLVLGALARCSNQWMDAKCANFLGDRPSRTLYAVAATLDGADAKRLAASINGKASPRLGRGPTSGTWLGCCLTGQPETAPSSSPLTVFMEREIDIWLRPSDLPESWEARAVHFSGAGQAAYWRAMAERRGGIQSSRMAEHAGMAVSMQVISTLARGRGGAKASAARRAVGAAVLAGMAQAMPAAEPVIRDALSRMAGAKQPCPDTAEPRRLAGRQVMSDIYARSDLYTKFGMAHLFRMLDGSGPEVDGAGVVRELLHGFDAATTTDATQQRRTKRSP